MEKNSVQQVARVLRVLVVLMLAVNILCLLFVPGFVCITIDRNGFETIRTAFAAVLNIPGYENMDFHYLPRYFIGGLWLVWFDAEASRMTLFFWLCGVCTAVILWQAKRILDTILAGDPFQMANARSMNRAATACWVISGAALVRFVTESIMLQSLVTIFTYNTLFIPCFFMAGLLFRVMAALFRQAAELQEDQDLTI